MLGWPELDSRSAIAEVIMFVEGKEMARDAMNEPRPSVAGMLTFRKTRKSTSTEEGKSEAQVERDLKNTTKCA